MSRFRSMGAMKSYVSALMHGHEESGEARAGPQLFVTVSRQAGAGGTTVAEILAELLNRHPDLDTRTPWTVFDRELVQRVISDHGLQRSLEDQIQEDSVSELQTIVQELFGAQPSSRSLVAKTCRTILHLATAGNAIIVGRAANMVTATLSGGVHVRLVGSPERRLVRMGQFYRLSGTEAEAAMKKKDRGRRNYHRKYFDSDVADPVCYDMVLNTDHLGYTDAAHLVLQAVLVRREQLSR